MSGAWEFWIDRGGTFTDVVARRPDGSVVTHKLLSADPARYDDAVVAGIRALLELSPGEAVPPGRIAAVKMGTTVATNALLTRTGEPTALVITRGFADAPRIGYQNRPDIFAREIVLPELLHTRVVEADERLGPDGRVIRPLDLDALSADLDALRAEGFASVAIVFAHADRHPAHERAAADMARAKGFAQVSVSHEVSPLMKLVGRADTTVADAYLSPVLRRHIDRLAGELPGVRLMFMRSHGGLTDAAHFGGKDAMLSGPAGGIVAMAATARAAGFERVIGFDMGGTSTDISHHSGRLERVFDTEIGGIRVRAPMLAIHTIAAGGGSVLRYDAGRYRVGPDSAGADPGPVAYGRGGPLTVTDANVLLGRIQPGHFPRVFGESGTAALDDAAVRAAFAGLATDIGDGRTPEEVAEGFLEVAVGGMANAIKKISVRRGHDVTEYALVTFGGAGGQHACRVAEALGMRSVLIHPYAGVLSAYGMGLADTTALRQRSVELPLTAENMSTVEDVLGELEDEARTELREEGVDEDAVTLGRRLRLRYEGTDTIVTVDHGTDIPALEADFAKLYRRRFSFLMPGRALLVEAVEVEARCPSGEVPVPGADGTDTECAEEVEVFTGGAWERVPLHVRDRLRPGHRVDGPAIIAEANATTVVEPGWSGELSETGDLVLTRHGGRDKASVGTGADPVMLEVFNNLFMSIAEQMGVRLQATANSVNIKERLDFSCALFDAEGNLIANAPHIPVHLGSMGESIKAVIAANPGMRDGDVFVLNNPYRGGTHLPDITVVSPVFGADGPLFHVASRGHHAEIGGTAPGSMPADSTHIDEEGVLIDNWLLVRDGHLRETETLELLAGARFPSRGPQNNIADLRAQVAANAKGIEELTALVEHFGLDVVRAYMEHVRANAEEAVREVISALTDGSYEYEMDGGQLIKVAITVDRERREAHIDFTGTSPAAAGNFNAPSSVAMAAVLYVFRTLIDAEIPLNAGCLAPIAVTIPPGSLLSPVFPSAVVAGNVETSQAVTGALYAALGVMAEGAGTMNNVTFGNEDFSYYETVAGGSGAGPGFAGTDVVQVHMTNSRLTDPEVLEWHSAGKGCPVLVESFAIRHGSGGNGRWRGGSGGVRRLRFEADATVSLLSGRRLRGPYGMAGGEDGSPGRQWIEHPDGSRTELAGCDRAKVRPGDVFVLETPGGGGYGDLDLSTEDGQA
ncbi:hydantoinase B/oxoprolinase family protein [Phytomonospora sp. NPDC050363]|uniref:hydantoinase B/oxoprolinase family protein n=1 Tax=Phytomonospora sp. NPDC050363 TaxID=3155642 RepID=UPI0033BFE71D